ncbi:MAG TPA: aldo/keto reductase, partial [Legionella sp.]|nr:aldo/keto reductase [Legionella sp.]
MDGQPELATIEQIFHKASTFGVDLLDTASGYGESEALLGQLLIDQPSFKIITKTIPLGKDE